MTRLRFIGLFVGALAASACTTDAPSNRLRASGYVEATEVQIGAEVGGRVVELLIAEGERVGRGEMIARLDTRETELRFARTRAERAGAVAQLRLLEAGAREEDIRQADAQVAVARAEVTVVEAEVRAAERDLARFELLFTANAGSQKERDDAQARVDVAVARRQAAEARTRAAEHALARLERGARIEELDAARARVATADAQMAVLQKALDDAAVRSPVSGIVTQTIVDAGELVAGGTPLVVVTDLDNAWANVFVPEPVVPRIALGQSAEIFTDAGGQALTGRVTFISPRAEFTPRNVQTAEERSKLVYRIKVGVDNRGGILKIGMPVDAELELQ